MPLLLPKGQSMQIRWRKLDSHLTIHHFSERPACLAKLRRFLFFASSVIRSSHGQDLASNCILIALETVDTLQLLFDTAESAVRGCTKVHKMQLASSKLTTQARLTAACRPLQPYGLGKIVFSHSLACRAVEEQQQQQDADSQTGECPG
jgi:hypothetical protein